MLCGLFESPASAEIIYFQYLVLEVLQESWLLGITGLLGFAFIRVARKAGFFKAIGRDDSTQKLQTSDLHIPAGSMDTAAEPGKSLDLQPESHRLEQSRIKEQHLQQMQLPQQPQQQQQHRRIALQQQCGTRQALVHPQGSVARFVEDIVQRAITSRSPEDVLAMFNEMHSRGKMQNIEAWTAEELGSHTKLEFFSAVVKCAALTAQPALVIEIFDDMEAAGVRAPLELYDNVIRILSGKKHFGGAIAVYDRMLTQGIKPTTIMLSCLVSFAAELSDWNRMMSFFEELGAIETPSIRTYMTVLRAHAKRGDWAGTRKAFEDMHRRQVNVDTLVLNAILSTGVMLDEIEQAEAVFQEAIEVDPSLGDVVSYNTLLKGYAKRHDATNAQRTLERMQEAGVSPNTISFNTAIDAAVRSSRIAEAWSFLEDMQQMGLHPDKFTCSILAKSFYDLHGTTTSQVYTVLDMAREVYGDPPLLGNLFRGILEAASRLQDFQLLRRVLVQMAEQRVSANLLEAPGPVGPTRRQRGLQGRSFRAGPLLRLPIVQCAEEDRFEDGLSLLSSSLSVGIVPPPEAISALLQAAARCSVSAVASLKALAAQYNLA
eukprot:gnl/TRDRNA2_/TRDRNA2_36069_c0_seq1.p1 gnl/TRDRNA2_/TRDRNA2_36069_c0~~gnl/TRDRNA2_/TRDRNA2_36069_c0_seq1.p1  ORF type:complete len:601 (-),score=133.40 gnl/TRDRNA2_/TRDRNA2_36069_c0_seq1:196-1998(-)